MSVYEGVEGKAISPAGGEVLNVDLRVPGGQKIYKFKPKQSLINEAGFVF